jgi:hypothetical protein
MDSNAARKSNQPLSILQISQVLLKLDPTSTERIGSSSSLGDSEIGSPFWCGMCDGGSVDSATLETGCGFFALPGCVAWKVLRDNQSEF